MWGPVRLWCVNMCSTKRAPGIARSQPSERLLPFGWVVAPSEVKGALHSPVPSIRHSDVPSSAGQTIRANAEQRLALDQVFDSDADSDSEASDPLHSTRSSAISMSNLLATTDHVSLPQSRVASEVSSSIGEHYLRYGCVLEILSPCTDRWQGV